MSNRFSIELDGRDEVDEGGIVLQMLEIPKDVSYISLEIKSDEPINFDATATESESGLGALFDNIESPAGVSAESNGAGATTETESDGIEPEESDVFAQVNSKKSDSLLLLDAATTEEAKSISELLEIAKERSVDVDRTTLDKYLPGEFRENELVEREKMRSKKGNPYAYKITEEGRCVAEWLRRERIGAGLVA